MGRPWRPSQVIWAIQYLITYLQLTSLRLHGLNGAENWESAKNRGPASKLNYSLEAVQVVSLHTQADPRILMFCFFLNHRKSCKSPLWRLSWQKWIKLRRRITSCCVKTWKVRLCCAIHNVINGLVLIWCFSTLSLKALYTTDLFTHSYKHIFYSCTFTLRWLHRRTTWG